MKLPMAEGSVETWITALGPAGPGRAETLRSRPERGCKNSAREAATQGLVWKKGSHGEQ